jgi:predicted phage terminase large subunit-like protein
MALPPERREILTKRSDWRITARPDQLTPEGDWLTWLILAGRGWGKTRTGAEDAAWYAVKHDGVRVAVVAPTYADARDTCIEGESGLLSVLPASYIKAWNRSLGELILVNDSRFKLFSADEPERLRGPQHHRAWADELAAWKYPAAWDQLQFGLRLGDDPRVVVTTTPKPTPLVRQLVKSASTRITRGSTFDNAKHLAPAALAQLRERYEGTRLGRQELYAEILDDVPGALWTLDCIDAVRIGKAPEFQRVVVAVDPSGTTGDDDGDAIGIIVAGKGIDGRAYIIADRTCSLSPAGWGRQVVQAYHEFNADRIVAEKNFGGAMVEAVIRTADPKAPVRMVNASRGKIARAEPVAALYEQGRVSHVGQFDKLEDEMIGFTSDGYVGEGSPDRADALVWALTDLMLGRTGDFEWYVGT